MQRFEAGEFSRRDFMTRFGFGVAASTILGGNFMETLAAGRDNEALILGSGKHRYEWVRGWGRLPEGMKLGSTHGAAQVDSQGLIYFNTDSDNAIIVFDADGKFIRSFGREWKADKEGNGTHGMQIRTEGKEDFIYLTNLARNEFAKLTIKGDTVWVKGYPQSSGVYKNKSEFKPTGIAVAPGGEFYVTDGYGANYIHRFNAKGEYLSTWGGKGTEDGKFNTPHAIMIDLREKTPTVLVTDRANHRLQWFSLEGAHLKTLDGVAGDLLRLPATLHQRGTDIVVGDLAGRITILDRNNKLVTHIGDNVDPRKRGTNKVGPDGWLDGQFISPHGVCWDQKGNLYIEEWMSIGRIVKLKRMR